MMRLSVTNHKLPIQVQGWTLDIWMYVDNELCSTFRQDYIWYHEGYVDFDRIGRNEMLASKFTSSIVEIEYKIVHTHLLK